MDKENFYSLLKHMPLDCVEEQSFPEVDKYASSLEKMFTDPKTFYTGELSDEWAKSFSFDFYNHTKKD